MSPGRRHKQKMKHKQEILNKNYSINRPAGSIMNTNGSIYKKSDRGKYRFRRYLTKDCQTCPLKNQCTARDQGRLIERAMHQEYVDRNDNRVRKDM